MRIVGRWPPPPCSTHYVCIPLSGFPHSCPGLAHCLCRFVLELSPSSAPEPSFGSLQTGCLAFVSANEFDPAGFGHRTASHWCWCFGPLCRVFGPFGPRAGFCPVFSMKLAIYGPTGSWGSESFRWHVVFHGRHSGPCGGFAARFRCYRTPFAPPCHLLPGLLAACCCTLHPP